MTHIVAVNWELLFQPQNMVTFAVIMGCAIPIFAIGFGTWEKVKKHQREVILKRDMVERGYSADEIERILKAKGGK